MFFDINPPPLCSCEDDVGGSEGPPPPPPPRRRGRERAATPPPKRAGPRGNFAVKSKMARRFVTLGPPRGCATARGGRRGGGVRPTGVRGRHRYRGGGARNRPRRPPQNAPGRAGILRGGWATTRSLQVPGQRADSVHLVEKLCSFYHLDHHRHTRERAGNEGPRGIGSGCEIRSARGDDLTQTVLNKNIPFAGAFFALSRALAILWSTCCCCRTCWFAS